MTQAALFDLDHLHRQSLAAALRDEFDAGPGRGLVARHRYAWVAGVMYRAEFGPGRVSSGPIAEFAPHPVFEIGICQPGARWARGDDEREVLTRSPRCSLTLMDRDVRVPPTWKSAPGDQRPFHGPGDPMSLPVCLGCDWEGSETNDEDAAIVEGLDHCWPDWHEVPPLERPSRGRRNVNLDTAWWRQHVEACERLVPGWEANGYPLLTVRSPLGTRSHHSETLGRWDVWCDIRTSGADR